MACFPHQINVDWLQLCKSAPWAHRWTMVFTAEKSVAGGIGRSRRWSVFSRGSIIHASPTFVLCPVIRLVGSQSSFLLWLLTATAEGATVFIPFVVRTCIFYSVQSVYWSNCYSVWFVLEFFMYMWNICAVFIRKELQRSCEESLCDEHEVKTHPQNPMLYAWKASRTSLLFRHPPGKHRAARAYLHIIIARHLTIALTIFTTSIHSNYLGAFSLAGASVI